MLISQLRIPREIIDVLIKEGISELYPPQEEAFTKGVAEGGNWLICTPTASGKTLIAEVSIMKSVLERGGVCIYLVPLRALASEKYELLKSRYGRFARVAMSVGDYDSKESRLSESDIVIMTYEKFDSIMRHKPAWLERITDVVLDEVHTVSNRERGPTLELTVAKLMYMKPDVRIIALSATVRNPSEISKWLKAKYISTNWRPVPLREGVYYRGKLYFEDGIVEKIRGNVEDPVLNLIYDELEEGGQILIFYSTRSMAVNAAYRYSEKLLGAIESSDWLWNASERLRSGQPRTEIIEKLASCIPAGVAFHHAGLPYGARKIVEEGFRKGFIKVLCATPTLAAGVNLPARRVVIHSLYRFSALGGGLIPIMEYKQMAGRAGRPQYDEYGEAIIVARSKRDMERFIDYYVKGEPEPIKSNLRNPNVLPAHVLSLICILENTGRQGILKILKNTLLAVQEGLNRVKFDVENIIEYLRDEGFIKGERIFKPTRFGLRTSQLYISPSTAIVLRECLKRTRRVEVNDFSLLHAVCVTPDMDKPFLRSGDDELLESYLEDYSEYLLIDVPDRFDEIEDYEEFMMGVKAAITMNAWIMEASEAWIEAELGLQPGDVYRMVEACQWLLYSMGELARLFRVKDVYEKLRKLRIRVMHGIKEELIPIVAIRGVGRVRARRLFNAGYRSLGSLASASVEELASVEGIGKVLASKIKEEASRLISASHT